MEQRQHQQRLHRHTHLLGRREAGGAAAAGPLAGVGRSGRLRRAKAAARPAASRRRAIAATGRGPRPAGWCLGAAIGPSWHAAACAVPSLSPKGAAAAACRLAGAACVAAAIRSGTGSPRGSGCCWLGQGRAVAWGLGWGRAKARGGAARAGSRRWARGAGIAGLGASARPIAARRGSGRRLAVAACCTLLAVGAAGCSGLCRGSGAICRCLSPICASLLLHAAIRAAAGGRLRRGRRAAVRRRRGGLLAVGRGRRRLLWRTIGALLAAVGTGLLLRAIPGSSPGGASSRLLRRSAILRASGGAILRWLLGGGGPIPAHLRQLAIRRRACHGGRGRSRRRLLLLLRGVAAVPATVLPGLLLRLRGCGGRRRCGCRAAAIR